MLPLPVRGTVRVPLEDSSAPKTTSRFEGRVDLCVTRALRTHVWRRHPDSFGVKLGGSAAVGVERVVKSVVRRVDVDFSDTCGSEGQGPWLTPRITTIERTRTREGHRTLIELSFDLVDANDELLWQRRASAEVDTELDLYTRLFVLDADRVTGDLAHALRQALDEGRRLLAESEALRLAIESRS